MRRRLWIAAASLVFILLASGAWLHYRTVRYDHWIRRSAADHDLDFHFVKSLIYEESWFRAQARGRSGEIGLMQITPAAAGEYAARKGLPPIAEQSLLEPQLNIEVGCWYLGQSVKMYRGSPHPLLYALFRYNAGESRADAWLKAAREHPPSPGDSPEEHYLSLVDFPKTRTYTQRILARYRSRTFWF